MPAAVGWQEESDRQVSVKDYVVLSIMQDTLDSESSLPAYSTRRALGVVEDNGGKVKTQCQAKSTAATGPLHNGITQLPHQDLLVMTV